ncbi:hypothetical protein H0H93_009642, partial [Arthromyces matolae]
MSKFLFIWLSPLAIVEDARLPNKYRMLLATVDVIFADVAQPDQARIVAHNAESFLRDGGHCVISIKASCIDSTMPPETIFASEVQKLKESRFKPLEQVTLEPYERDHAMVTAVYQRHAKIAIDFGNDADSDTPHSTTSSEFEEIPYPSSTTNNNTNWPPAQEELPLHYMNEEKARRRVGKGAHDDFPAGPRGDQDTYNDDGKDVYNKIRSVKNRVGSGRPPPTPSPPATTI